MEIPVENIREKNSEVWMCGTDTREGADWYFELHGLKVKHENVLYELPESVYRTQLPINNTICAMLVCAWIKGFTEVSVVGAPMNAKHEYIEQRAALAYVIGYLNASGMEISWEGVSETLNYGKKQKSENYKEESVEEE